MATIAIWLRIDEEHIVPALREMGKKLASLEGEAALDFSSVRRIDMKALAAIEEFLDSADRKGVKVVMRGVSIGVYKALKLVKLAPRFSYAADDRGRLAIEQESSRAN